MYGIGDAIGQMVRFLMLVALTGIGGLVAAVFSAFGASGPWLLLFPAAGFAAGLIVNNTILGD